jgi:hypothetical protein
MTDYNLKNKHNEIIKYLNPVFSIYTKYFIVLKKGVIQ